MHLSSKRIVLVYLQNTMNPKDPLQIFKTLVWYVCFTQLRSFELRLFSTVIKEYTNI